MVRPVLGNFFRNVFLLIGEMAGRRGFSALYWGVFDFACLLAVVLGWSVDGRDGR